MIKSRSLYLAIAAFTLAVQVAAAAHSPAFHEEPVSRCQDHGAHFCPETVDHETGPCVLCQVSLNGAYLERLPASGSVLLSETVALAAAALLDPSPLLRAHAPRGPPVG